MSKDQMEMLKRQIQRYDQIVTKHGQTLAVQKIPPMAPRYRAPELHLSVLRQERQQMVEMYVSEGLRQLMESVSAAMDSDEVPPEPERDTQEEIRIRQLELLPLQRQLRGGCLELFRDWFGETATEQYSMRKNKRFVKDVSSKAKKMRQKRNEEEKRQVKQTKSFFDCIHQHADRLGKAAHKSNTAAKMLHRGALRWHDEKVKNQQKMEDKMKRDRIKALKANDEETYMKLMKDTKNERISHLLNETNQFLSSLGAKLEQEKAATAAFDDAPAGGASTSQSEVPTPRSAAVRFLEDAHTAKEEVTEQPTSLGTNVGQDGEIGLLKPYQLVGLNWLLSLYNNSLNGILAVRSLPVHLRDLSSSGTVAFCSE